MKELDGYEKFHFIVSLLRDSEFLKLYVKHLMRRCKNKSLINRAIREFPIVLADITCDDWTITEYDYSVYRGNMTSRQ